MSNDAARFAWLTDPDNLKRFVDDISGYPLHTREEWPQAMRNWIDAQMPAQPTPSELQFPLTEPVLVGNIPLPAAPSSDAEGTCCSLAVAIEALDTPELIAALEMLKLANSLSHTAIHIKHANAISNVLAKLRSAATSKS